MRKILTIGLLIMLTAALLTGCATRSSPLRRSEVETVNNIAGVTIRTEFDEYSFHDTWRRLYDIYSGHMTLIFENNTDYMFIYEVRLIFLEVLRGSVWYQIEQPGNLDRGSHEVLIPARSNLWPTFWMPVTSNGLEPGRYRIVIPGVSKYNQPETPQSGPGDFLSDSHYLAAEFTIR